MERKNDVQKRMEKRYWWYGGIGTGLLGFGLCALVESAFLKHNGAEPLNWILAGTGSLILVMTGINLLFASFASKLKMRDHK